MVKTAKDLVKAFLGKQEKPDFEENVNVYPLRNMVNELLTLTQKDWILYAFSREPLEGKFSLEEKYQLGYLARVCGENESIAIKEDIPNLSFKNIALRMGFNVHTPDLPNGGANVTFAQYEESGDITIFMDTVKKAEPILYELRDILGDVNIFNILLLHELFHGIELNKADTIYTQTKKIELWKKPFSNKSKIGCLSEIAAMSFAESVLDLPYNPYIFDVILMYLYNKEAATMLYEDIVNSNSFKSDEHCFS